MKIKIEDMRAAFQTVDAVSASAAFESSQFVKLRRVDDSMTLSLTGTMLSEAKVDCAEPGKWIAYVDRRALKAFLSTARAAEVELAYSKDGLVLKAGQKMDAALHAPISGYETWKPAGEQDLPADQREVLCAALKYLPTTAGAESVEAVSFIKGYGIVATDTIFLMASLSPVKQSFFIPSSLAAFFSSSTGKLSIDERGIGVVLKNGFVYQPRSSNLDQYPTDMCKTSIAAALKAPTSAEASAEELLDVISTACQFLLDKTEDAATTAAAKGIVLSVDMGAGAFQKTIPAKMHSYAPAVWPIKRLAGWLDFAAEKKATVEIAKMPNAGVFRFVDGKTKNVFVFADV